MTLTANQFDFDLPEELIAQHPLAQRSRSRLMVLRREDGAVEHSTFADLPELLREGDLLVVNDTRVIPAKFFCRRATGAKIEGLFIQEVAAGQWQVMLRGAGKCKLGERLTIDGDDDVTVELLENDGKGQWRIAVTPAEPAVTVLDRVGRTPLPPYIRRADASQDADDRQRYQTVYAAQPGAVAAPTAGLHFTDDVLAALDDRGIERVAVTLHVGRGTFLPVKVDHLADHDMHAEWYELSAAAAERLSAARAEGRRIVAVGTTSVRVLETIAQKEGRLPISSEGGPVESQQDAADEMGMRPLFAPASGWTDIFLYPPADFLAVDALITNFHLPKSTLVMLIAAFCSPRQTTGTATILNAYAQAVANAYRFYSYGDAMLIE